MKIKKAILKIWVKKCLVSSVLRKLISFQIQWLFNKLPVHGKDFLVSVSGERQVLTIPEVAKEHSGTVSCVAENAAGKAICSAKVEVGKSVKQWQIISSKWVNILLIKNTEN